MAESTKPGTACARWLSRPGPLLGLLFVVVIFAVLCPPQFSTFYNAKTVITQTVIIGIGALGMTVIMISGGIDLSPGSQIALCSVVVAIVLKAAGAEMAPIVPLLAALAGIAACAACGLVNGLITAKLRIVPFIVTLGMMQIARGLAKWLASEQTVIAPANWLNNLMLVDPEPAWLIFAPGVWVAIILLVLLSVILQFTVFGRYVFAIGSNEMTARLCGIRVGLQKVWIYTLCSVFVGISGVMQYANLTVGDPTAAGGMELDIIASVVIGGGSLSGGEGSALGSLIGALIMAVLRNGCNMLGVPNYVQDIIIGVIIVAAVAVDRLRHRG